MMHPDTIQRLRNFRNELHMLFGKRADALFELCDAAAPAGPAHAFVHWLSPSEGSAVSADVTWQAAIDAGGPHRGCIACHSLIDPTTGHYTLGFEAEARTKIDYGIDHPNVAPDGTSMKPTDQVGVEVCMECHSPGTGQNSQRGAGAPISLRDIVHPAHMNSPVFLTEFTGNCFSCHDVRGDGSFELLGSKVQTNELGTPRSLIQGQGSIPGAIGPSEKP